MKRFSIFAVLVVFCAASLMAADPVFGLWKIIDDATKKPTAIVSLYPFQGKLYGRIMIVISEETGQMKDSILTRTILADKVAGTPPVCGLDIIYQMEDKGKEWFGYILDPKPGDEYECVIRKDGENLVVRGQLKGLGFLGRDQKWVPVAASDIPEGIVLPDPASFVPVIPRKR